ncbi:hypothetical protein MFIFM68171_03634 [Madurella fahalii]|uniref:Uncharacterized protein n=1 Tax=Madurella fahalii TaxID=1157608 RepID=A0ABQ0G6Z1_9PEZI
MPPTQPHSLTLRPTKSATRIFIHSQFFTKIQRLSLTPSTSLAGKTALITGGNTGLGYLAARHLLSLDLSRLILAVRSPDKGKRVAQELRAAYPRAAVDVWELEMGDYDSVRGFARRAEAEFSNTRADGKKRLDIAILNAGMTRTDFARNAKTGHCEVVQVNYLSTFLLAMLLLPVMRDRAGEKPGRLSIVNSGGAYIAKMPNRAKRPFLASFDDPAVQPWDAMERYFASKVLGMMFFVKLFEYLPSADELVVNLVDPGFCKGTDLHRDAKGLVSAVLSVWKGLTARSLEDGAWTYVDAAVVKGKESHGCFVMDWELRPFVYIIYEPEGPELIETLFEETMAELEFAGVREILGGLKTK